jgi:ubiquinone/menaquinone biosynthesis C-methylase UbiE
MSPEARRSVIERVTGQKVVCPWWLCYTFDNPLRRLIHPADRVVGPYVRPGDRVIDIGPGMGHFTLPLAKRVGPTGCVTAIDIQAKMLSTLMARARKRGVPDVIRTHLASLTSLGSHEPVDFILAFWMLHEVPDQGAFLSEIQTLLKSTGAFLLVEPKFHVPRSNFLHTLQTAQDGGWVIREEPRIRMSHSALLVPGESGR